MLFPGIVSFLKFVVSIFCGDFEQMPSKEEEEDMEMSKLSIWESNVLIENADIFMEIVVAVLVLVYCIWLSAVIIPMLLSNI